jgi:hypothetical protein
MKVKIRKVTKIDLKKEENEKGRLIKTEKTE